MKKVCSYLGVEQVVSYSACSVGGAVVHSYGRLIFHERVITDRHQLQPPNNDNGDGKITCRAGEARFTYYGIKASTNPLILSVDVLNNFKNAEGMCHRIYHHLFLSNGE